MSILYTYIQYTLIQSCKRYTYLHFCRSLSPTHSLSGSHVPSLHCHPIVIPLCKQRGIRSCVTELLSDIRAVQMDDPTTLAWPTDKKPSLFVRPSPLALAPLSFSESTAAVICYTTSKKKFFSQDSMQGHILKPFFGPSRRNRKPCGTVTSSASHRCVVSFCS